MNYRNFMFLSLGIFMGMQGMDDDTVNVTLSKLLQKALHESNFVIAKRLIESGAPVNELSDSGQYPLHVVLAQHVDIQLDLVRLIIQRGANVQAQDSIGITPLWYAWYSVSLKSAYELINAGASILTQNAGKTFLQTVEVELKSPVALNFAACAIEFAMHNHDNAEISRLLLHGSKSIKWGFLLWALQHFHDPQEIAQRCNSKEIAAFFDQTLPQIITDEYKNQLTDIINARDYYHNTILHYVTSADNDPRRIEQAKWLLDHGARVKIKNKDNKTPYDIARAKKNSAMMEILKVTEEKECS